jgi:hypothetical protein
MPASIKKVVEAVKDLRSCVLSIHEEERSNSQKDISVRKTQVWSLVRESLMQWNDGCGIAITGKRHH